MFYAAPLSGVQLESSRVMLPKFCSDPMAHHKWHALTVIPWCVQDLSLPIDVGPSCMTRNVKIKLF
jgi:hypothetical protein